MYLQATIIRALAFVSVAAFLLAAVAVFNVGFHWDAFGPWFDTAVFDVSGPPEARASIAQELSRTFQHPLSWGVLTVSLLLSFGKFRQGVRLAIYWFRVLAFGVLAFLGLRLWLFVGLGLVALSFVASPAVVGDGSATLGTGVMLAVASRLAYLLAPRIRPPRHAPRYVRRPSPKAIPVVKEVVKRPYTGPIDCEEAMLRLAPSLRALVIKGIDKEEASEP